MESPSGLVTGTRIDQRNYRIRLTDPTVIDLDRPVDALGRTWSCSYIELGTPGLPHAVVPYPGLSGLAMDDLRELGKALRWRVPVTKPEGDSTRWVSPVRPAS